VSIEKKLNSYKENLKKLPNELKIQETVKKSIDTFCMVEQERLLTYWEFLWAQLRLIQKRWWLFQFLFLSVLWMVLPFLKGVEHTQRVLGIIASLFVILIIPEFWKNRTYQSMEIEATSYYSLRQIYASRMLLFGIVDIVLVTLFCGLSSVVWNMAFSQLLVQFILPMMVTACICFGILCSKYSFNETFAVMMCIAWNAVWLLVVLNEQVYAAITFPLWLTFLGCAIVFLIYTVYRTVHGCDTYWEGKRNGIDFR